MPTYTIQGLEVDFPYDAYPCQVGMGQWLALAAPERAGAPLIAL